MTAPPAPVGVGLIGAGWIGSFHGESLARRVPGARLVAVADPAPGAAHRLADRLGVPAARTDPAELIEDPEVEAVVIASPATTHAELVVAAAGAGKAVFCEKPMAVRLADADRAVAAAGSAGVPLQVGFNRRFAPDFVAAYEVVAGGGIGTPRQLRSLTRDPGGFDPAAVRPGTIFLETLIHDFDTLRWLNPGAAVTEVYAVADALVEPQWRDRGLLDTATVLLRFDNGAIGIAEACFEAAYGYDVRGEVFGSAGMVTAGSTRATGMTAYGRDGRSARTVRSNVELFHGAYTAELAAFVHCVRTKETPPVTGADARAALAVAVAAAESVRAGRPVRLADVGGWVGG